MEPAHLDPARHAGQSVRSVCGRRTAPRSALVSRGKFAEADAFKEITGPDGKPQKIFGMPGTNQTHVNQARQKWLEDRTKEHGGFTDEQTNTVIFRHGVPRIARVLANVATYMIADDHEVTDDWNLNQKWRNRVYSTKTGKDIIRNGVAAFGVFQGWGNDPVKFDTGNNKDFLDKTRRCSAAPDRFPMDRSIASRN